MNQSRKVYLEAIRSIAIIFVIFNHTDGWIYYTVTDNWLTWLYSIVSAVMCRTGVPLFFMISGELLLEKEESLKALFRKRVIRIIMVLITVSALYYLLDMARGRIPEAGVNDFLMRMLSMHNGVRESFWFLHAYLFFLLSLPFLRKLAPQMNKTLIIYLIFLKGISDLMIPFLNWVCDIFVLFDVKIVSDYIYYALLGYYLSHMGAAVVSQIKKRVLCAYLGVLVILSICIVQFFYLRDGNYALNNVDMLNFLLTPVLWLLTKKISELLPEKSRINNLIILTGSCAFGIYLLDNFVRWQFLPLYLYLSEHTVGVLASSVYVMLVFVTGGVYTWLLKKIPLLNKFL